MPIRPKQPRPSSTTRFPSSSFSQKKTRFRTKNFFKQKNIESNKASFGTKASLPLTRLGEDLVERVIGVGGVLAQVLDGSGAEGEEVAAQEGVGEEQVGHGDGEAQALAQQEVEGVTAVGREAVREVLGRGPQLGGGG